MSDREPGADGDRERLLRTVRAALVDVATDEPPTYVADPHDPETAYHRTSTLGHAEIVDRFCERCAEYRATVARVPSTPPAIRVAIAEICERHRARRIVVAAGLDAAWVPETLDVRDDATPLTIDELEGCDGALTASALAIATTGTIVLDGGPGQGRRVVSLLPDLHVCVVVAASIVATVPEAMTRLHPVDRPPGPLGPITLISGPSATSDIELDRVEGVHGPRRLEVLVIG